MKSIFRTPRDDPPKRNYDDLEILERSNFNAETTEVQPSNIYRITDSPKAAANAHIHVRFGDQQAVEKATTTKTTFKENAALSASVEEAMKKFILLLLLPALKHTMSANALNSDAKFSKRNIPQLSKGNETTYQDLNNKIEKLDDTTIVNDVSNSLDAVETTTVGTNSNENKPLKLKFDDVDIDDLNVYKTGSDAGFSDVKVIPLPRPLVVQNEPKIEYKYVPVVNYYPVPVATQYVPKLQYVESAAEVPSKKSEVSESLTFMSVPVLIRKSRGLDTSSVNHDDNCRCSLCSNFDTEINAF